MTCTDESFMHLKVASPLISFMMLTPFAKRITQKTSASKRPEVHPNDGEFCMGKHFSDFLYKCENHLLCLADVLKYLNWSKIHRCDFDGKYLRYSESTWLDLSSFSSICVRWRNGPIILVFSMKTFPRLSPGQILTWTVKLSRWLVRSLLWSLAVGF